MKVTALEVLPSQYLLVIPLTTVVELRHGDTLRVNVAFYYMGPAITVWLRSCIGNRGALGFDEILVGRKQRALPASTTWTYFTDSIDILITTAISPGTGYDLYAKVEGFDGTIVYVDNCITILAAAPQFQNFQIVSYVKV